MKKILLIISTIFTAASCTWDNPMEDNPPCVNDAIVSIKHFQWNASVWQYQLNGSRVYFVDYSKQCCDFASMLYDDNCNIICSSGGWGGSQCEDSVSNNLTGGKLLYAP